MPSPSLRLLAGAACAATAAAAPTPCAMTAGPNGTTLCRCAGVELSHLRGTLWNATAADGGADRYQFSICDPIPPASLPAGCRSGPNTSAVAALRHTPSDPTDCTVLGSVGDGAAGMSGEAAWDPRAGESMLTLSYAASSSRGCDSTFTIAVTDATPPSAAAALPGPVHADPAHCRSNLSWTCIIDADTCLGPRPTPPAPAPPPPPPLPPPPPPPRPVRPAEPCDLESCVCAEQDLSILAGRAFHTAVDAEGYIYQFAICGALPADALPSGCAGGNAAKGAAVVKYKEDQDADCSELGSVGPCGAGERCGLTAEWTDDASGYATTLLLHYAYTTWAGGHGRAVDSFTVALTDAAVVRPGVGVEPGPVRRGRDAEGLLNGSLAQFHYYNTTRACLSDLETCAEHTPRPQPPEPPEQPEGSGFGREVVWVVAAGVALGGVGLACAVRSRRRQHDKGGLESLHDALDPQEREDQEAPTSASW